ncbi:MAG: hypothetical protein ABIH41_00860 [Nanoarchaeota archaeon]
MADVLLKRKIVDFWDAYGKMPTDEDRIEMMETLARERMDDGFYVLDADEEYI